ncbi:M15 family metallopeptidase [Prosthecobacter dejongeii]|uniref:Peptidoglycan L-alanyl-D-glutamate endopeptidase CwlK n=1 Tax=Prosthecobacter dejongeii TaxID=48465 RepID=A0A7W8DNZ6_9BACT|nr:M15 family metallopeptidase [Prosthecobacter dejongeii]MBB5037099.1 peptidoglycan L-alanyl-D-glutamate endopeptidase CwlK [Prosthecobacter dejongeii]
MKTNLNLTFDVTPFLTWFFGLIGRKAVTEAAAPVGFSKRTLENLSGLNDRAQVKLEGFVAAAQKAMAKRGVMVEVISGLRSWPQQAALYAQGRTKPGKVVTNARPGSSWHNYGLAIDLGLFKGGIYLDEKNPKLARQLYAELGQLAASMNVEWAGTWKSFPEGPHFQTPFGLTLAAARAQMQRNGLNVQRLTFPN